MFGMIKPAHIQMRAALPPPLAPSFDQVARDVESVIPSWWDKGSQDRTIAIVMGAWIEAQSATGHFFLKPEVLGKVHQLVSAAHHFNARDNQGQGSDANALALDLIRVLREGGVIPVPDTPASSTTAEELSNRKQDLQSRLDRLKR